MNTPTTYPQQPKTNLHEHMKALIFKRYGGTDNIAFADILRPALKSDEILVQVHAAGLNPIDCMIPKGTFKPMLKFQLPATLGSDLAGVVVEVGSRVTRFKPGDAVFASIFDLGTGALAEFAVVPENAAAHKPANLEFVQAASIPMVGLTSWQALKERAKLKPDQLSILFFRQKLNAHGGCHIHRATAASVGHNGAQSYYSARAFRGSLRV
jgi:NADPH:quinone reductase-like Zn-dependent oxidoreductase